MLRLLLLCWLCTLSFIGVTQELRVKDTASLTQALAQAQDGDTLVLDTAVYEGNFSVTRSIHIKGEAGATLDALRQGSALTITAPKVIVEGAQYPPLGAGSLLP